MPHFFAPPTPCVHKRYNVFVWDILAPENSSDHTVAVYQPQHPHSWIRASYAREIGLGAGVIKLSVQFLDFNKRRASTPFKLSLNCVGDFEINRYNLVGIDTNVLIGRFGFPPPGTVNVGPKRNGQLIQFDKQLISCEPA